MVIKNIKISDDEIFCCSIKEAKTFFKNSNVYVSFGFLKKTYTISYHTKPKNKIKGIVVASYSLNKRDIFINEENNHGIVNIYVLKKKDFSEKNRDKFEKSILPQICEYNEIYSNDKLEYQSGIYNFLVEFYNNEFIIHKYIYS